MPRKSVAKELTCLNCGTVFIVTRTSEHIRKFCGKTCHVAYEAIHGREVSRAIPIDFSCKHCGKPFTMKPAYLTEYRKKFDHDPLYCSSKCFGLAKRAETEAAAFFTCLQCGKVNAMKRYEGTGRTVYYRQQKFCDQVCKSEYQRSAFHQRFADGDLTRRVKRGYVVIRVPTKAGEPRREMLEHRYVMEQFLGRPLLPTETVHHKRAWDKTTNTMENLELRTGNHGPGGAVEDLVPWCVEMLKTYPMFITPEQREDLRRFAETGAFERQ